MDTIGDRIKHLRVSKGMSMAELEDVLGSARGSVNKWEKSKSIPGSNFVISLSNYFKVSTDWILKGECHEPSSFFKKKWETTSQSEAGTEPGITTAVCKPGLTPLQQWLVSEFQNLNEDEQRLVFYFLDMIKRMRQDKGYKG